MSLPLRRKIGLACGGIVLGLAGLELVLRVAGFGYVLSEPPPGPAAADYKIFCIGESSTWGIGVQNRARDCYPKQLERLLAQRYPAKRITCFYDLMIGQNTSENLAKLPSYLKRYRPDLVILMVGVNNWWNMDKSNAFLFSKNDRVWRPALKTLVFLDSFRVWKLGKWLYFSLGRYQERWNFLWPDGQTVSALEQKYSEEYGGQRLWDICSAVARHDLEEMVKICRANRIPAIICAYPGEVAGSLGFIQEEVAIRSQVPYVDFRRIFEDLPDKEGYFSQDRWHPNERGYALMAWILADLIAKNKMIE